MYMMYIYVITWHVYMYIFSCVAPTKFLSTVDIVFVIFCEQHSKK